MNASYVSSDEAFEFSYKLAHVAFVGVLKIPCITSFSASDASKSKSIFSNLRINFQRQRKQGKFVHKFCSIPSRKGIRKEKKTDIDKSFCHINFGGKLLQKMVGRKEIKYNETWVADLLKEKFLVFKVSFFLRKKYIWQILCAMQI